MIAFLLGATLAVAAPNVPAGQPAAVATADQGVMLIPGVPPGPPPSPEVAASRARELGGKLRCPVCQGSNIRDSPSSTAQAMFERTKQLIAAGYTDEEIVDYFVDKYGEFILLDPQQDGLNIFLFVAPGLAVGLGLALALKVVVGWRREPGTSPVKQPAPEETEVLDQYERRLLAELSDE